jgi:hypothetical protein
MSQINSNTKISRNLNSLTSEVDGKAVIMNIQTGVYHELDAVATAIWSFLVNSCDVKSICSDLKEKYEVDQKRCEEETIRFLQQMTEKNLIVLD